MDILHPRPDDEGAPLGSRARQADLARIVEDSLNEIYVFDRETLRFIVVNRAARENLGYTLAEMRELTPIALKPELDEAAFSDLIEPVLAGTEERVVFETMHQRKNGTTYPVEVHLQGGSYGGEPAFVAIILDITARKVAFEEQFSLERQVQHAQKLESLGLLAGGIAHDFNNLLMAVLGNADVALAVLSPVSPARKNLDEILNATRRAADLAKQMLAYSGKGKFSIVPIDLQELVLEMGHLLEVSISKKNILKYDFADNLPTFDGDATQVRQVVMNLITNAAEAIGDASGVIALSTGAMHCDSAYLESVSELAMVGRGEPLSEGMFVYVEVSDSGCGMEPETVKRIFDPFFTTKFTGRGLGLSAVLGIVRGHDGAIKIYSEPGRGTSVKVLFPANGITTAAPTDQGLENQEPWTGEGTVLVADDEESVRAVCTQMLEHLGFKVLTARDGGEAISVFREHQDEIVCILLDMTMPHLDGEQAFRELRAMKSDIRVVLCSGYNQQDATQRFIGKGLAGFLQKPYSLSALKETLQAMSE
jgi:PAS domain S-box-containing protein